MALETTHSLLTAGSDFQSCSRKIHRFFNRTPFVAYEVLRIEGESSCTAAEDRFWEGVAAGTAANRLLLTELFEELAREGYTTGADFVRLPQGYPSKLLHTISHLLDGFFGVDSRFYNLVEDSHWVSEPLRRVINQQPHGYWLCQVAGRIREGGTADRLAALRRSDQAAGAKHHQ